MTQHLDGDALDNYLRRIETTFQNESDRLLSQPVQDREGIHRMRGAANAAASIRKQLPQFKIPTPARRARATPKKDTT